MKLVECVPNISEGRDKKIIDACAAEVESVENVWLLDVDPGAATNRTVFTFAGEPEATLQAAFLLIKKAARLIDMKTQKGEHARNGATDVCPFVPLAGSTMDDCVELAKKLGQRVGNELKIPVYLYENAATRPERRMLADIRKGEYEALKDKLGKPEWKPDFGPNEYSDIVARSGATQISAREFLIAYNINLNTQNTRYAKRIGLMIRDQGGAVIRDENGKKVRGADGKFKKHEKGLFDFCKATGWFIEEYNLAQVTMNLTNYKVTSFHEVFDKVCELAEDMGVRVIGSEVVGLVPEDAMLKAGQYYLEKQKMSTGVPKEDLIKVAIMSCGLEQVSPFNPSERLIEYRLKNKRPLVESTVTDFADELSRNSPAPGGGSVAAVCGALSAGLSTMVANLTVGKPKYKKVKKDMIEAAQKGQELKDKLLNAVDDDTFAFNKVMDCFSMPKSTDEQKSIRDKAILEANKNATLVPLSVMELVPELVDIAEIMATNGNENSLSDAGVALLTARSACMGAYYNVLINLQSIDDEVFSSQVGKKASEIIESVNSRLDKLDEEILKKLKG